MWHTNDNLENLLNKDAHMTEMLQNEMTGLLSRAMLILILWWQNLGFTTYYTEACMIQSHFHHVVLLKSHTHRTHIRCVSLSPKQLDYARFT
jgi:hypothetical protein